MGRRQYEAAYPGCNWLNGDLDGDADVDFDDIAGFTSILSSGNSAGPAITYVWDAENRLTEVRPTFPAVTAGAKKVVFAYDYMNRRVRKRVYNWNSGGGSGAWETTPCLDRRFVYDGWLLLLELDGLSTPTPNAIVRKYTWGLDLSGLNGNPSASGLRAAGGIGGLLAVEQLALPAQCGQTALAAKSYWYFYDANGNVGQLIDEADDSGLTPPQAWAASRLAAKYEYDPYGNITSQSGAYAEANLIRFSTKYFDQESGLGYWGYRFYSTTLGRWLSRDPIAEHNDNNVYRVWKNTLSLADPLGLCTVGDKCFDLKGSIVIGRKVSPDMLPHIAIIISLSEVYSAIDDFTPEDPSFPTPGIIIEEVLGVDDLTPGVGEVTIGILDLMQKLGRNNVKSIWTRTRCQECTCKKTFFEYIIGRDCTPKWKKSKWSNWTKCTISFTDSSGVLHPNSDPIFGASDKAIQELSVACLMNAAANAKKECGGDECSME